LGRIYLRYATQNGTKKTLRLRRNVHKPLKVILYGLIINRYYISVTGEPGIGYCTSPSISWNHSLTLYVPYLTPNDGSLNILILVTFSNHRYCHVLIKESIPYFFSAVKW